MAGKSPYGDKRQFDTVPDAAAAASAIPQIAFTLTVHMADGTTKDIPCIGTFDKEKHHDNCS